MVDMTNRPIRPALTRLASVALLAVGGAACGSGDGASTSADSVPSTPSDPAPATDVDSGDTPTEQADGSGSVLSVARPCLDDLDMNVASADEADGWTPDVLAGLGIEEMLVFELGAGWGGTIEAYASGTQADIAEAGYADSPLGYDVDRVGDVVFKTTGTPDDLVGIAVCLGG